MVSISVGASYSILLSIIGIQPIYSAMAEKGVLSAVKQIDAEERIRGENVGKVVLWWRK
jgi:hypothetical protein